MLSLFYLLIQICYIRNLLRWYVARRHIFSRAWEWMDAYRRWRVPLWWSLVTSSATSNTYWGLRLQHTGLASIKSRVQFPQQHIYLWRGSSTWLSSPGLLLWGFVRTGRYQHQKVPSWSWPSGRVRIAVVCHKTKLFSRFLGEKAQIEQQTTHVYLSIPNPTQSRGWRDLKNLP